MTVFTAPGKKWYTGWPPALYVLALVAITAAAMWPCLGLDFVNWDDPGNLLQNPQLNGFDAGWNWQAFFAIFTTSTGGNYNPLPIATFAIEQYFFAPNPSAAPVIFHLDNLLLHLGTTIAAWGLARRLGLSLVQAFVVGVLFGIHPLRVESVAWVTERKDVLYGLFFFLSLGMYVRYAQGAERRRLYYAGALVMGMFSAFSKVQAVTLPLSMVAVDVLLGRNWYRPRTLVLEKLPWWLLSAGIGLANIHFLHQQKSLGGPVVASHYGWIEKLATGAYSYAYYLVKLVAPVRLSHYHEYPVNLPVIAYVALAVVPAMLVTVFIFAWKRRLQYVIFGLAFFTFNVMFLLQVMPAGDAFLAERFTYVAYFGLFVLLVKQTGRLAERHPQWQRPAGWIAAAYLCTLGCITYGQVQVWRNSETLYSRYISNYPRSFYGYKQLGVYYMVQATSGGGTGDERRQLLERSLEQFRASDAADAANGRPSADASADVYENLGVAHGVLDHHDSAIYYFTKEATVMPGSKDAYANRAFEYSKDRQYREAIADYGRALAIDNNNDGYLYDRGGCHFASGNMAAALADYRRAAAINGREPKYHIAQAVVYRRLNNSSAAQQALQQAKALGGDVTGYE